MRAWTLGVSIAVHLCFIAGVVVSPLLATDELPTPRRTTAYVPVIARDLQPPPAPRPAPPDVPRSIGAPLMAPDVITPEPPAPPASPGPTDFDVIGGDDRGAVLLPNTIGNGDLLSPPPPPPAPRQPLRVGGDIKPPQKTRDVVPRYPAMAQAARVEGLVILEAVISEGGTVQNVRVLRGQPPLDEAAVDAVRQWRFTPTLLNGEPVPVVMTVTVSFTLK